MQCQTAMNDTLLLQKLQLGRIPCPCGGTFRATDVFGDPPVILHTMPACGEFLEKDLLSYLRWVNEKYEETSP